MAAWWDTIQIKKGTGGYVTEEQKNNLIEHAVTTWEGMGLTDDQIAFGIGVMGIESGFYPHAKGLRSKSEYGLGQFTEDTWKDAVDYYNTRPEHKARQEQDIDPEKGKDDPDSQIPVIGAWIPRAWGRAAEIPVGRRPTGYSFDELAYGKWHQGLSEQPGKMGKFFASPGYNNPEMRGYFLRNVDRARQSLRMRKTNRGSGTAPRLVP